jgi:hypothetical protein
MHKLRCGAVLDRDGGGVVGDVWRVRGGGVLGCDRGRQLERLRELRAWELLGGTGRGVFDGVCVLRSRDVCRGRRGCVLRLRGRYLRSLHSSGLVRPLCCWIVLGCGG